MTTYAIHDCFAVTQLANQIDSWNSITLPTMIEQEEYLNDERMLIDDRTPSNEWRSSSRSIDDRWKTDYSLASTSFLRHNPFIRKGNSNSSALLSRHSTITYLREKPIHHPRWLIHYSVSMSFLSHEKSNDNLDENNHIYSACSFTFSLKRNTRQTDVWAVNERTKFPLSPRRMDTDRQRYPYRR